jgi:hypothetical protein
MEVTLFGIVTLAKSVHAKAPYPMEVTLSGIVTLVKDVHAKAPYPMEVTGIPFILSGM